MPDLMTTTVKPVALIILDGWGVSQKTEANALALARLPFYNSLLRNCPWTLLKKRVVERQPCEGQGVGLRTAAVLQLASSELSLDLAVGVRRGHGAARQPDGKL